MSAATLVGVFKSMYIHRHDEAMRKILKAITQGKHGSFLKIADIGRDELVKDLGTIGKRIPAWLVSDSTIEACGLDASRRDALRPDILLIEASQEEQAAYATNTQATELISTVNYHAPGSGTRPRNTDRGQPNTAQDARLPRQRIVWVLEGGYTSDTRYLQKVSEKQDQHKLLMQALKLRGFDVRLGILAFGVGGTIFKTTRDALKDVGIEPNPLKKLLRDINTHSVQCLHNIVVQRRKMDSDLLKNQTRRPP